MSTKNITRTKVFVNNKERKNVALKEIKIDLESIEENKFLTWKFNRENLKLKDGDNIKVYYDEYLLLNAMVKKSQNKIEFIDKGKIQLIRKER